MRPINFLSGSGRVGGIALVFFIGLTVAAAGPSWGAACNVVVDDLGDASDADLGNPACATAGGGCTLRAAMEQVEDAIQTLLDHGCERRAGVFS